MQNILSNSSMNIQEKSICNYRFDISGFKVNIFLYIPAIFLILLSYSQAKSQTYPAGFSQIQIATGITKPTVMEVAPDGRIFIAQQNGVLRIFKNGNLLTQPFISLSVNSSGERGLIGIAFDPDFATNQYIYLYYTVSSGTNNRISRFTANGDEVLAGSEVVLLNLDPLSAATNHNGGTMQFGPDGKLYVGVGENANTAHAQNLDTYHGKILRLNADGTPADGNPFSSGSVQRRSIWAYGMRNPYTLTFQPGTGMLYVNDVGQSAWEEINNCTTGGLNYGWPAAEGMSNNVAYTNPVYSYGHGTGNGIGCAITGGTFFNPSTTNYPPGYTGNYFYIDYCSNWIDRLSISGNTVTRSNFASSIAGNPIGIITGNDGNIYFLARSNNSLYKIEYSSVNSPIIATQPQSINIAEGNEASFSVTATGVGPLSYQWRKNGNNINLANSSTYTIANVLPADAGNYSVVVTNSEGTATSNDAILSVSGINQLPVATILTPTAGSFYTAGTLLNYSGVGNDNEDGQLGAASFEWFVNFHHDMHTHPGPFAQDGVTNSSFSIPNSGETSADVFYRLYLVVTDSQGAKDTAYTDILPNKSTITINTNPQGLGVTIDGQPYTAPVVINSVEGILRTIGTSSTQTINNALVYNYSDWSQGGVQTQTFATPQNDVTYTANFTTVMREADNPDNTVNGLNYSYFQGLWSVLPDFGTLTPVSTGTVLNFDLSPRTQNDNIGFRFTGYILVPSDGIYTFYTSSDEGSKLYIGSTLAVNNDGQHTNQESSGQIGLRAGKHEISVDYFELSGQEILTVSYEGPGNSKQLIPNPSLFVVSEATLTEELQNPINPADKIKIYPQPAKDMITIEIPKEFFNSTLNIVDMNGKLIRKINLIENTVLNIPLNYLENGIYLITLQNNTGIIRKKIIVEK